jgi:hypothetical protein
MGRYRNGNYYRSKNDPELKWLEDSAGLFGKVFMFGVCSLVVGIFQLGCYLVQLVTSDNT